MVAVRTIKRAVEKRFKFPPLRRTLRKLFNKKKISEATIVGEELSYHIDKEKR